MAEKEYHRSNILIVDPERDMGELFARALETSRDCKCYLAAGEGEVLELLKDIAFDIILVDLGLLMPGDYSLLKRIRRSLPGVVVVVGAYLHQKGHIGRAVDLGAQGYIIKPIKVDLFRRQMDAFRASGMSPTS